MWHVSTSCLNPKERLLRPVAFAQLAGVGDSDHEWIEWTGRAFHLRRRLTVYEQEAVGAIVDIRGTPEALQRFENVKGELPPKALAFALEELGPVKL